MDEKTIKSIRAREILDSRGNPTVETDVILSDGSLGRAAVPSGASTGSHEALELRDGNTQRYGGKGVLGAIEHIHKHIAPALCDASFTQHTLDNRLCELDGTEHKEKLGANALLGVSLAFARASAKSAGVPLYQYFFEIGNTGKPLLLPVPLINILNGGKHAEHSTDFQEFMIVPAGAATFREAIRYGAEVFHALKKLLSKKGFPTSVGDEGGYAPPLGSNKAAVEVLLEAIQNAGFTPGTDIWIALDVAATELYSNGAYHLPIEGRTVSAEELIQLYADWCAAYPIISIEDGLAEDDWSGYSLLTKTIGARTQLVGDDLFVTNKKRLDTGIAQHAGNSILIKLNQIGTVSETIDTIRTAYAADYTAVVSHRSGETEDTTIADFAVGMGCGQIKTGSVCRSERVAKYNQLLRIEEELQEKASFAGTHVFSKTLRS